jgi:Leucine rich repeat
LSFLLDSNNSFHCSLAVDGPFENKSSLFCSDGKVAYTVSYQIFVGNFSCKRFFFCFGRITFLTIADRIASETYKYTFQANDGNYYGYYVDANYKHYRYDIKHLYCESSAEAFGRMVFLYYFTNLETIDANTCGIIEIDYDLHKPNTSASLILNQLHTVDLSNNNIGSIKRYCFYSLQFALKTLNLSSNVITHFAQEAFHDLKVLEILDLSNNRISSIAQDSFKDFHKLKEISIANNQLWFINFDLFINSKELLTMNFRENKFKTFQFSTSVWKDLTNLDLDFSFIVINRNKEQFSKLVFPTLSSPLPQCNHSSETVIPENHVNSTSSDSCNVCKDLSKKNQEMFLILILVSAIFSTAIIFLMSIIFRKPKVVVNELSAQTPVEMNPIYQSMLE